MSANPAVARRVATLTLGTFVLAITTSVWGQSPKSPPVMPSHSIVRAASDVSAPAFADEFEVWVVDQSNSPGVSFGGTIHIYEGSDLIDEAAGSAVPTDVVNLGAATSELCFASTGANPVRPHMVFFNSTHRHAILAFVASGHVVIFDAASRTPLSCIRTSVGAGGARQAHAALPAPDDSYILVANQNGKLLERISTDYSTNTFALDPAATLNLATCMTPSGAACQAPGIRPDNAPIVASVDSSSALGFVTLRGGGMFVVNATATPMTILGEYDNATVHPNGMGAVEVRGWMFVNSGGGTSANLSEFDVYRFPLSGYDPSNLPNTPAPEVLFSDDNTVMERDSHGTVVTQHGRYLWVGDRARNVAEVFDTASGAHVNTVDLISPESDDPTPDYADISPSGNRIFFALRGPNPLTGDAHVATGSTPGLGVVQVNCGGKGGFLKAVAPISNVDSTGVERADPHGIRVRMKSSIDCNANTIFDSCDIDCGAPGGPCDVPGCGASTDCDGNLIPDDCQTTGTVFAAWTGGVGTWEASSQWCPDLTPNFPNNRVGTNYDVAIDGVDSLVTLNTSPSINALSLTGGATVVVSDAGGANVRTLYSDGDITNEGVFRVTDRERLVLDALLIDQGSQCGVGGALEATDGAIGADEENDKSILEVNGARVVGGIARTIGDKSEIHLVGGAELVDMRVDGVVVIPNGQTAAFSGTVTNDGIMSVRGSTLDTRLDPRSADAVLDGAGCVQLTSQSFSRLGDFKASFTNSATHRIEGAGLVYGGMANNGTLRADLPGEQLILFPPGNKRNDGLFLATGEGTLRLADDVIGLGSFQALEGTILLKPADEFVSVQGSSLDIGDAVHVKPSKVVLNADTSLEITDHILVWPAGSLELNGNATVSVGQLELDGTGPLYLPDCCGAAGSGTVAGGRTPPAIKISGTAQVQVSHDLVLRGGAQIGNSSSGGILLGGSFDNQNDVECDCLLDLANGKLIFEGKGTHRFEISGVDRGLTIDGFGSGQNTNYAVGTIEVQAGVIVEFVDDRDYYGVQDPPMCDEALYVHELIVGAGAQITAPNCRVYAEVIQGDLAAVAGMGMCGVAVGFLPTGDIDGNRRVDLLDWASVGSCLQGPGVQAPMSECSLTDFDGDSDVDLKDLQRFQTRFTGP